MKILTFKKTGTSYKQKLFPQTILERYLEKICVNFGKDCRLLSPEVVCSSYLFRKSAHFKKISEWLEQYVICVYETILDPKNDTKKMDKIHKNLGLYQVFMHNSLCQNVPIFPLYILLTRRIDTFWSMDIDKFWSGGIEKFWVPKMTQKKSTNIFDLYQVFIYIFFVPKYFNTPKSYSSNTH